MRDGETLSSIAANLWGDSSLWYKLAEANGLSANSALTEGASLRIPAGVMKNTHNASTFKPYDPAEAIGDTSPTTPKPPKQNKCGAFGQILLVVVAAVVAFATQQYWIAKTALDATFAGGAIAGAASSIASQAVGVATGIQEKFSWTSVASAALAGGLGANAGAETNAWKAAGDAIRNNVISQAASIALGPQKKFDWAGVAASGVGRYVGASVEGSVGAAFGAGKVAAGLNTAIVATASSVAYAATRSAIDGSSFGDNLRASIPDVIGQAISSAITSPTAGQVATEHAGRWEGYTGGNAGAAPQLPFDSSLVSGALANLGGGVSGPQQSIFALPSQAPTLPSADAERILGTVQVNLQSAMAQRVRRSEWAGRVTSTDPNYGLTRNQVLYRDHPHIAIILGNATFIPSSYFLSQAEHGNIFENNDPWSLNPMSLFKKSVGEIFEAQSKVYDLDHNADLLIGIDIDTGEYVGSLYPDGEYATRQMRSGSHDFATTAPITGDQAELALALYDLLGSVAGLAAIRGGLSLGPRSSGPKASGLGAVDVGPKASGAGDYLAVRKLQGLSSDAAKLRYVDPAGVVHNLDYVSDALSSQRQLRHVAGSRQYKGGGYFDSIADAEAVFSAFRRGEVDVLAVRDIGGRNPRVIFRYEGVTGFNNNRGAGYMNQPTNIFELKGSKSPSIVPKDPTWK